MARIMRHPFTMVGSDGRLTEPGTGHPHPRWYGAFPRVLGHYVREKKVLPLAEAVRKMTSLPAARVGFAQRGQVKPGWFADLVVFDPKTIIDKATFEKPHQYPEGIHHVFINGITAIMDGKFLNVRAGQVLRRANHSHATVFPEKNWKRWPTPQAAGWSAEKLKAARAHTATLKTAAVMIVQGGKVVDEWGEIKRAFNCHSMRKSILSALYGPHVWAGTINRSSTLGELGINDNAPSLTLSLIHI